jgi:NADPH-dependent ferric siderophore reductase
MSTAKNVSAPASAPQTTPVARVVYTPFPVTVSDIQPLGASFLRVTLRGEALAHFAALGADQRIKLVLPTADAGLGGFPLDSDDWYAAWRDLPETHRPVLRTYTVRAARTDLGEIDVDFVVHGETGPATRWVLGAAIGDEILIVGPDARSIVPGARPVGGFEFHPGNAGKILLAGDETAVPAICAILESLPKKTKGQVFLEVPTEADILPVSTPGGVTVCWLARDVRPDMARGAILNRAVRAWVSEMMPAGRTDEDLALSRQADELPAVDVDTDMLWEVPADDDGAHALYSWIAGEAGCIKELRRFLVRESGLHRADVAFMGYWREGRAEN